MDRQLAQMVAIQAAREMHELGNLVHLLKGNCDQNVYDELLQLIGNAIGEVGLIKDRCFKEHPDLEEEFELRLEKYGRSY